MKTDEQKETQVSTIQEALNNVQTVEDCINMSEYFIKVAFTFMKKAEQIEMSKQKETPEKLE